MIILCVIFVGVNEVNYDRFPDEEFQKKWIRTYLHMKRAAAACSPNFRTWHVAPVEISMVDCILVLCLYLWF